MTTPDVPNNRPEYAPARRPGESLDLGRELVILHLAASDVHTVAALIEAGAAALKYAPGSLTDYVELNARRRNVRLGRDVARALRAEHRRRTTPPPAPKRKRGT